MEQLWVIDDDKKQQLNLKDAVFIFEQAEKQLKDTIESSGIIISRTNTLITLISGVLIAILGFCVSKVETKDCDSLLVSSILGAVYLFFIGLYIVKNIMPTEYVLYGEPPKTYLDERYFVVKLEDDETRLLWYYINTIQQYQKRIDINKITNETRWSIYQKSLSLVIYTPLVLGAIYTVCKIVSLTLNRN